MLHYQIPNGELTRCHGIFGALKHIEIPCAACRIYGEQVGSNVGDLLILKAIL